MKRKKPMERTGFKRKVTTPGVTKSGVTYIAHGDRPMDAKGKAALANIMEAAAKQLSRTKPMRRRSKKMAAIYKGDEDHEGRAALVARLLRERPTCQAGHVIGAHYAGLPIPTKRCATDPIWDRCTRDSVDVHEILARSAGGSILDESNLMCLCRRCHDWIGDNPKIALALGLRRSRYAGRNPRGGE